MLAGAVMVAAVEWEAKVGKVYSEANKRKEKEKGRQRRTKEEKLDRVGKPTTD